MNAIGNSRLIAHFHLFKALKSFCVSALIHAIFDSTNSNIFNSSILTAH